MIKIATGFLVGLAAIAALFTLGASAADEARVRVIHSSPDAPAVDVYANGTKVLSDVPYLASSGYMAVPAGDYTFEVFASGADPAADAAVITLPATLEPNTDYTVVALGALAAIQPAVFVDDNTAPAAGKAHISVVHAGADAPAVDVAVTDGPVLVSNLALGEGAGPLPVDAGTYNLELRVAGTTDVALSLPNVSLSDGSIYTLIATGFLNSEPALTVEAYAETPLIAETEAVAPPASGSGGLLGNDDTTTSYLPWAGMAVAVAVLGLLGVRLVSARSRA